VKSGTWIGISGVFGYSSVPQFLHLSNACLFYIVKTLQSGLEAWINWWYTW
jgi:hypothetical protein